MGKERHSRHQRRTGLVDGSLFGETHEPAPGGGEPMVDLQGGGNAQVPQKNDRIAEVTEGKLSGSCLILELSSRKKGVGHSEDRYRHEKERRGKRVYQRRMENSKRGREPPKKRSDERYLFGH